MLAAVIPLVVAFFIPGGVSFPYPFTNSTPPSNSTSYSPTVAPWPFANSKAPSDGASLNATIVNPNNATVEYNCDYAYPSDVTVLNQRYPDYNSSHLHSTTSFFMLRREIIGDGEIATGVQFEGLPSKASNTTCRLEFVLPQPGLQHISGFNPSFNVYQVARDNDTVATWDTYEGNNGAELFGMVNGQPDALNRTRLVGGVAAINETVCNETLTFQMG